MALHCFEVSGKDCEEVESARAYWRSKQDTKVRHHLARIVNVRELQDSLSVIIVFDYILAGVKQKLSPGYFSVPTDSHSPTTTPHCGNRYRTHLHKTRFFVLTNRLAPKILLSLQNISLICTFPNRR